MLDLENTHMDGIRDFYWQTDDSAHDNRGYKTENVYRDSTALLHQLIDIATGPPPLAAAYVLSSRAFVSAASRARWTVQPAR